MDANKFLAGYLECALWSSTLPDGLPLDDAGFTPFDLDDEAWARCAADCARFRAENADDLDRSGLDACEAGHAFWLNRNGHGCGFWDGRVADFAVANRLDMAARGFGEVWLMPYGHGSLEICG